MPEPTITVLSHTQVDESFTLSVRVAAPPERLSGIAGETTPIPIVVQQPSTDGSGAPLIDDDGRPKMLDVVTGHDTQISWIWPGDVPVADQLAESAALVRAAWARTTVPASVPAPLTEPGTEL